LLIKDKMYNSFNWNQP